MFDDFILGVWEGVRFAPSYIMGIVGAERIGFVVGLGVWACLVVLVVRLLHRRNGGEGEE